MTAINQIIKRNEFQSEFYGTGRFWIFNNGQFGEKIEIREKRKIHLSYHYDRVYMDVAFANNTGNSHYGSYQIPLTSITDESTLAICREIFEADKNSGIIDKNYCFC